MRLIRTVIPYAYHNADLEGRPIYIEKTGRIATAALADEKICDPDHLLHSHIYGVELLQKQLHENSLKKGERVNGICTILDFDGLGFHHRQCLSVLKTLLDFDKKYYPEYLGKLFIINSPWVGPYLYQAVQVFLDEVTKARIQIISESPKEFLLTRIAPENLPKEYGGNCDGSGCKHGGLGAGFEGVKGCIDVLDQSNLKAEEVSGLDAQEVSYDFEREVAAGAEGDVFNCQTNKQARARSRSMLARTRSGDPSLTVFLLCFSLFPACCSLGYFEVKDGYDIDFSVELLPVSGAREADPNRRVLIHKVGRHTAGKGTFKAPFAGAKVSANISTTQSTHTMQLCTRIGSRAGRSLALFSLLLFRSFASILPQLLFRWDNNFSYFNSKHIRYTVQCMAPTSALDALIASGGSKQEVDKANKADAAKAAAAAAEKK